MTPTLDVPTKEVTICARIPGVLVLAACLAAMPAAPGTAQPSGGAHGLLVLLANDDGIDAPDLRALIDAFQPVAQIAVAAPATEQSGKGHGLTLRDPIFVSERRQADGSSWYAIDGPPATCVRLAVEALLPRRPDLVISGINRGDNLGATVFHAGTLGAAREGAIVGIAAIAVSIRGDDPADYQAAAAYVRQFEGTDVWGFVRGYITVTPMTLDVTDGGVMKALAWVSTGR